MAAVQLKELKNGRLAMVAIIGQWVQELLTGQGPIEQVRRLRGAARCMFHHGRAHAYTTRGIACMRVGWPVLTQSTLHI